MKKSISLKIFSGYVFVVCILAVLIIPLSFKAIKAHHIKTLTNSLRNLSLTLQLNISPLLSEGRFDQLDTLVKSLGSKIQTRITVIDSTGLVLADSEGNPELMDNHRKRPEIMEAFTGEVGTMLRFSTTVTEEMLYVAIPIDMGGDITHVLRMSLFLKDINSLLNTLKRNIFVTTLVIVTFSLLSALFFSRKFSKPIRELNSASRKVASGDFDVRVILHNNDELKDLANSFNYMTDQIKTLFAKLSHQKEGLTSIISSIREGLCVLDKEGKILICNDSFKRIVQNNSVKTRFYWEVLREFEFGELIKKTRKEKTNLEGEITLEEKVYLCSAAFCSKDELVVILHDITKIKNLEKTKKDFVVNVSHELRTPLTAIKGFVETMEEDIEDKNRYYLGIIKRNTNRVISIVGDLLLLSKLEEKGTNLELEEVDLKDLVENVLKVFSQRLREKNIHLCCTSDEALPILCADPFKLEQVFINLIDNAIKYTEQGEIQIYLHRSGDEIIIQVTDTGIGIPKEHLPRIFERFYVVDPSRSRKLGGTGLGLSIVKHIVLLHKGRIEVRSIPGSGTTFIISIPLCFV
ncbi:MAG: cell wall metabolism sensor histidine kinase WalK [Planctomycetes bacterium]|nr:cell wall metabolism sensor histidine kinase WalK [Planctomycetota bacterium]